MRAGRTLGFLLGALLLTPEMPVEAGPPAVDAAAVALHGGNASNAVVLATQALADSNAFSPGPRPRAGRPRSRARDAWRARRRFDRSH